MEDPIMISDDEESIYQIGGNNRGRKRMINVEPGTLKRQKIGIEESDLNGTIKHLRYNVSGDNMKIISVNDDIVNNLRDEVDKIESENSIWSSY